MTTRDRIVEAALAEFDGVGYDAATTASICRRAGVSNGSLFHAFPTKEDVAGAVFLSALEAYHDALAGAVTRDTSPEDGVAALVSAHIQWVIRSRAKARFMFLHGLQTTASAVRAEQNACNERFRARLAQWYGPHFKSDAFHEIPPEMLISQIIGPAQMFCRAWLSERSPKKPDAHLPALIRCAVRAVVRPARPGQKNR